MDEWKDLGVSKDEPVDSNIPVGDNGLIELPDAPEKPTVADENRERIKEALRRKAERTAAERDDVRMGMIINPEVDSKVRATSESDSDSTEIITDPDSLMSGMGDEEEYIPREITYKVPDPEEEVPMTDEKKDIVNEELSYKSAAPVVEISKEESAAEEPVQEESKAPKKLSAGSKEITSITNEVQEETQLLEETWEMILSDYADDEDGDDPYALDELDKILKDINTIEYGTNEDKLNTFTIYGRSVEVNANKTVHTMGNGEFFKNFSKHNRIVSNKIICPMVNSGFNADVIGAGLLDLATIYDLPGSNVTFDYQIDKQKTMLTAVVNTSPRFNQVSDIPKLMYRGDYDILSWGYVCATLKKITHLVNCPDNPDKLFEVEGSPIDLLQVDDKLINLMKEANELRSKNQVSSIVEKTLSFIDDHGNKIVMGHTSYQESIDILKELKTIPTDPSIPAVVYKLAQNEFFVEIAAYIKYVQIGNMKTSNLAQKLYYLRQLSNKDIETISELMGKLAEDVYTYKFAFKDIDCPICGKKHTYDIANFDSLVFQFRQLMKKKDALQIKLEEKNGIE